MADNSAIEWTDATWNPIRARNKKTGKVGWHCEHATTGCEFCYAEGFNKRLGTGLAFKPGHRDDIEIFLDEEMLTQPLRWKKPRRIFVCSMTDLFADFVLDEWIDEIFAVMALSPQHTFQVLTKRAQRMCDYFLPIGCVNCGDGQMDGKCCDEPYVLDGDGAFRDALIEGATQSLYSKLHPGDDPSMWLAIHMPLPNVWLGVSTERQQEADERIPLLLQTPAAIRFISAEPLLGPIDLTAINFKFMPGYFGDALDWHHQPYCDRHVRYPALDWVIVGGESGPGSRPMHPAWARSLRDQCLAAGVPFFFKQWGMFKPVSGLLEAIELGKRSCAIDADGKLPPGDPSTIEGCDQAVAAVERGGYQFMSVVGKKAAGRLLDGVEHNGMPERVG